MNLKISKKESVKAVGTEKDSCLLAVKAGGEAAQRQHSTE